MTSKKVGKVRISNYIPWTEEEWEMIIFLWIKRIYHFLVFISFSVLMDCVWIVYERKDVVVGANVAVCLSRMCHSQTNCVTDMRPNQFNVQTRMGSLGIANVLSFWMRFAAMSFLALDLPGEMPLSWATKMRTKVFVTCSELKVDIDLGAASVQGDAKLLR